MWERDHLYKLLYLKCYSIIAFFELWQLLQMIGWNVWGKVIGRKIIIVAGLMFEKHFWYLVQEWPVVRSFSCIEIFWMSWLTWFIYSPGVSLFKKEVVFKTCISKLLMFIYYPSKCCICYMLHKSVRWPTVFNVYTWIHIAAVTC